MYVGALELDILFGDVRSLKQKRGLVRPVLAELRRRFGVAAAEVDEQDRYRRAMLAVAAVSADLAHLHDILDACEHHVADRPELDLLAVRRRVLGPED